MPVRFVHEPFGGDVSDPAGRTGWLKQISMIGAMTLLGASGCARPHSFNLVNTPAYGATGNCPQSPATLGQDPSGAGEQFSPDAARCSYADGINGTVVELGGQVRADLGPANPGLAAEGISVTLHPLTQGASLAESTGPKVAVATTDAQGNWHMSAMIPEMGDYILVARDGPAGAALAFMRLRIDGPDQGGLDRLVLVLPREGDVPGQPPSR